MKIIIPEEFQIANSAYNVKYDEEIDKENLLGIINHRIKLVKINPGTKDYFIKKTDMEENFLHEMTHGILRNIPDSIIKKINKDEEEFVELFAKLLHQALISGKGELSLTKYRQSKQIQNKKK